MNYTIDNIDPSNGFVTVTFTDSVIGSSQMTLASQIGGVPFTLSDAKQLDQQLTVSYNNWLSQNVTPVDQVVDPTLQKFVDAIPSKP